MFVWFSLTLSAPGWADKLLGLPPLSVPQDNPQTPEKIALGKRLFNDNRLSGDGTISCSSCHNPGLAFADGQTTAQGITNEKVTRNTPSLLNVAFYASFFWDGRSPDLETQALLPFTNPVEHGLARSQDVLDILRRDDVYVKQFKNAFGVSPRQISMAHVAKALASFERTLIAGDSAFDRYQYGGDKAALSQQQLRGLELFRTKALCNSCHTIGGSYAYLTDNIYHNVGVGFEDVELHMFQSLNTLRKGLSKGQPVDQIVLINEGVSQLGRTLATATPSKLGIRALGGFRTPTLRNVALTAPYMHDGSVPTLEAAVDMFNHGSEGSLNIDPLFRPLSLSAEEKADLVAFMKALTSTHLSAQQTAGNP
jgi:cytochrome c peroxidase